MSRVASLPDLARLPEKDLDRFTRRIVRLLVVAAVLFAAFYVFDRWRPATPTIVDQQISQLEASVRAEPADLSVRGQLADAYFLAERYDEAIREYGAILAASPALNQKELAHFGRARAYESRGELALAKSDYQSVVDIAKDGEMAHIDPMLNAAFYGLGKIALAEDKAADAVQYLSAAVAIKRSDADALSLLGTAYVANGEPIKAIDVLRQAVAFVPLGWPEPYDALADAYTAVGQAELATWSEAMAALSRDDIAGARSKLETLVEGPIAVDAMLGLGLAAEAESDVAMAAEWYRKVLLADPDNAPARLGLTRVEVPAATGEVSK